MLLLGYDLGSSSIKASLLDAATDRFVASRSSPKTELAILASQPGWAEQHPELWWEHVCLASAEIRKQIGPRLADVRQGLDRVIGSILSREACEKAARELGVQALLACLATRETAQPEDLMRAAVVSALKHFDQM